MLQHQERAFIERFYANRIFIAIPKVLSVVGVIVAVVGLALCVFPLIVDSNRWWTRPETGYVAVFTGFMAIFCSLPRCGGRIRAWTLRRADARSRTGAGKLVHAAKTLAPFDADFNLKGDVLIYMRGKEGKWQLAWHRDLSKFRKRGMAMQSSNVTAIFRRPTATFPSIVILQDNPDRMRDALREIGVPIGVVEARR
ncbi:MAG: hypothetical protein H7Y02_06470 [Candidatus Obscuribacterales bacterium]|nr:hypothetical protein [Steroidobacteraceae bacterium]